MPETCLNGYPYIRHFEKNVLVVVILNLVMLSEVVKSA